MSKSGKPDHLIYAKANKVADDFESYFIEFYKRMFIDLIKQVPSPKVYSNEQDNGIDRTLIFKNNSIKTCEEKTRSSDYPDFFLETISNSNTNSPGWIEKDLTVDYLLYAFSPIKTIYMFDWKIFKRMWVKNASKWKMKYSITEADNILYKTYGYCIPIKVVLEAYRMSSIICFLTEDEVPLTDEQKKELNKNRLKELAINRKNN